MSLESDIAVLREVPLFADLTDDQLRLLAFGADHRRLRQGEVLFRAEARADAGFVVAGGEVVLQRGPVGQERTVGRYGRGALIGELALITETRRPAHAVAATDCDLIHITRQLFRRMLEEYPEIAFTLHEKLADQLGQMTTDLLALEDRFR
ncbi:cyclic nucleotide-binding domain-containing protein [Aureimonas glaciei]|jgi:CRP-like cAMP-binding protein|uniref:Cyclic nucleotide-binding protein n=1 Tax=Aureimonas glaciei TaxID=1776957 RepID=A0A917DHK4_9HYPH|nr:cyclic nucleotide-binding domain-containing protein [Aureimonas glaciei]GGD41066.1 cyclic nucleotide-binding protein [Aureimonas glaciei]